MLLEAGEWGTLLHRGGKFSNIVTGSNTENYIYTHIFIDL